MECCKQHGLYGFLKIITVMKNMTQNKGNEMKNVDELLKERGEQYGSFKNQVAAITDIVNVLRDLRHAKNEKHSILLEEEDTENFFMALKLCRIQTSDDPDSLDDLQGYAKLIKEKRYGSKTE